MNLLVRKTSKTQFEDEGNHLFTDVSKKLPKKQKDYHDGKE
jgi:hypothetical protein